MIFEVGDTRQGIVLIVLARKNWTIAAIAIALLVSFGACTPAVITRIESKGDAISAAITPASFAIIRPTKIVQSAELDAAQSAVVAKLTSKGFVATEPATYAVDVTLSLRPANLALAVDDGAGMQSNNKTGNKNCFNTDYRLTVGVTRIADGALLYRSSAAETHCKDALSAIVPVLVDATMADFGAPRGAYTVQRKKPRLR